MGVGVCLSSAAKTVADSRRVVRACEFVCVCVKSVCKCVCVCVRASLCVCACVYV